MPKNNLSVEQIKTALEHCKQPAGQHDCQNCPYVQSKGLCTTNLLNDTIALLSCLQSEKERLENDLAISKKETRRYKEGYKMACTERNEFLEQIETAEIKAYKEFAERLHKEFSSVGKCNYGYVHQKIRLILKELEGGIE